MQYTIQGCESIMTYTLVELFMMFTLYTDKTTRDACFS